VRLSAQTLGRAAIVIATQPKLREIGFALVRLHSHSDGDLIDQINSIVEIGQKHGAFAENMGETVVFTVGAFPPSSLPAEWPNPLVRALLETHTPPVSVLYGVRQCLVGLFGSAEAARLRTRIPGFSGLVQTLETLAPGESRSA